MKLVAFSDKEGKRKKRLPAKMTSKNFWSGSGENFVKSVN